MTSFEPIPANTMLSLVTGRASRAAHAVVETMTRDVRRLYEEERLTWYARKQLSPPVLEEAKHLPEWRKLTRFLITNGIAEHLAYIHLQFCRAYGSPYCPTPTAMSGPVALQRWQSQQLNVVQLAMQLADALQSQKSTFGYALLNTRQMSFHAERPWTTQEIQKFVLLDSTLSLSALFRYTMARVGELTEVEEYYREEAIKQYMLVAKAYDTAWGDAIPEEIRMAAHEALATLR